jgi:hypothetical protein
MRKKEKRPALDESASLFPNFSSSLFGKEKADFT